MMDFGRLGDVIREASIANANRNIGPVPITNAISTQNYNFGSLGLSLIMHNEIYGSDIEFLWGNHTWDDRIHVVI